MSQLAPPRKSVELEDSGTQDIDSSDDHFSDASEGKQHGRHSRHPSIPITRVERVDDKPAHGETPGTEAYNKRTQDSVPDELEIIPEGSRSRSASSADTTSRRSVSIDIPKTVVDKVDPQTPSHGEVPNTDGWRKRRADAEPDMVREAPAAAKTGNLPGEADETDEPDALGEDDFDDFEVGGDDDDDDDFGGFDNGEDVEEDSFGTESQQHQAAAPTFSGLPPLSLLDLSDSDEIASTSKEYLEQLFPEALGDSQPVTGELNPAFLTERSQSLWAQLVAPPPLQPPDWVRSRIRRLFLVSLGVPVDLDEILPASKQKKLVLPSIDVNVDSQPGAQSLERLQQSNASSTSIASPSTAKPERRRKGPPPPPEFDQHAGRLICSTTTVAVTNMTDGELQRHVRAVEGLKARAVAALEYWLIQKDSAAGDKEAFEAVIENLVNHAKKIRK